MQRISLDKGAFFCRDYACATRTIFCARIIIMSVVPSQVQTKTRPCGGGFSINGERIKKKNDDNNWDGTARKTKFSSCHPGVGWLDIFCLLSQQNSTVLQIVRIVYVRFEEQLNFYRSIYTQMLPQVHYRPYLKTLLHCAICVTCLTMRCETSCTKNLASVNTWQRSRVTCLAIGKLLEIVAESRTVFHFPQQFLQFVSQRFWP